MFKQLGIWRDSVLNSDLKKIVAAILLSIFTIGGIIFGYIWLDPIQRDYFFGNKEKTQIVQNNQSSDPALDRLRNFNASDLLYKKKSLSDLSIYPKSWVKLYFNDNQVSNSSISGPDADPDSDGLPNKKEFLYGSNPINADTLGAGGKDGEYVQANRNPLTGLPLEKTDFSFYFLNAEEDFLNEFNSQLDDLASEGIDLPKLYELARTVDYSKEFADLKVILIENPSREESLTYLKQRLEIVQDSLSNNFITDLSGIYKLKDAADLDKLQNKNNGQIAALESLAVPKPELKLHQANLYLLKQSAKLIDLRKEFLNKQISEDDYKVKHNEIIQKSVWAYRTLNVEVNKLSTET